LFLFFVDPNTLFPVLNDIPVPYEKIIAIMVISGLILRIAFIDKTLRLYYLDYAFLALLAVAFMSIIPASDLQTAWNSFVKFFRIFLVYFLIVRIANTKNKLNSVLILYIISIGFLAVSSTWLYYSGEFEFKQGIQRAHSLGEDPIDPNTMATSLILGLPFMYYMIKANKNLIIKVFMTALMVACLWTIVLTGSRGGMVGAAAVLMLFGWQSKHRSIAVVVALCALLAFVAVMPGQYRDRFMTIFSVGSDDAHGAGASAYGRINGLILGFQFMLSNPLTGVGIGNFSWQHRASGGDWTDAHSLVGKLVGELGLLGVAAFSLFIFRFIRNIKYIRMKYYSNDWKPDLVFYMTEAIKIGLIMLFIQGIFGHNLFRDNWYIFAAYSVVLANLVTARCDETANNPSLITDPVGD